MMIDARAFADAQLRCYARELTGHAILMREYRTSIDFAPALRGAATPGPTNH